MIFKILLLGNSLLLSYNSLLPSVLGRPAEPRPGRLLLAASLWTLCSGCRCVGHWGLHWQIEARLLVLSVITVGRALWEHAPLAQGHCSSLSTPSSPLQLLQRCWGQSLGLQLHYRTHQLMVLSVVLGIVWNSARVMDHYQEAVWMCLLSPLLLETLTEPQWPDWAGWPRPG